MLTSENRLGFAWGRKGHLLGRLFECSMSNIILHLLPHRLQLLRSPAQVAHRRLLFCQMDVRRPGLDTHTTNIEGGASALEDKGGFARAPVVFAPDKGRLSQYNGVFAWARQGHLLVHLFAFYILPLLLQRRQLLRSHLRVALRRLPRQSLASCRKASG